MTAKVKLCNVRLSFPTLFEAKSAGGEGPPRFGASFLFGPQHPAYRQIEAAIAAVAKDKWGVKAAATLKALRADASKLCLRRGDTKEYDGYQDQFYVSASSKTRPLVLDRDKTPLVAADGRPYAGCYVNASIEIWAQDNTYGKRINATLLGVQFVRDGDAFGGSSAPDPDDFENLGVEAEEALESLV
jgi:Enterobacter phage Enc34, ssDNA-binding protein